VHGIELDTANCYCQDTSLNCCEVVVADLDLENKKGSIKEVLHLENVF